MNAKIVFLAAVLILGGLGAYYYLDMPYSRQATTDVGANEGSEETVSGMRAEENMVVVMEQKPGNIIVGSVIYLAAPGYLVIHEDNNGEPGAILGSSTLLSAGESAGVEVALSRASKDGETLHAMLHFEKGANATFFAAEDTPVPSRLGGPISGWFEISSEVSSDTQITI
ncbi:hypothetical protein HY969_04760 [Candidatus Kaiserbacteria bacterium]|nr:hypothetical protein [Candidatus Kaiserbacteria bacterium]